jgi:GR25 family glycosyltransferase involved in LPS biosynthesis
MFKFNYVKPQHSISISLFIILSLHISTWPKSPDTSPSNRFLPSRKKIKLSATDPEVPDIMPLFELGEGPWIFDKVLPSGWKKSSQCNPYSGRCSCLREWDVHLNECMQNVTFKPVILEASGWMTDWPYLSGLHRCEHSMCEVRHGHTRDSRTHARLFSVTDASVEKANSNGAIMVVVAMESRSRFPLHGTLEFKYFFDLGVSYHNQLDIQVSYNNYLPKDFSSTGAPFDQKRDPLLFIHTNCGSLHRNELFDKISRLIPVDALGSCKKNGDVATILPMCAGISRSGNTVWSESECLLHHYKFYLSIENSIDEDYVTEKLYQGLRAGSVPIYFGATNIRDYLPHPDSVLLISDFESIDVLIDYVKLATADKQVYAKHMLWKTTKLTNQFMDRVVTKPMNSIFCKVCDLIATNYGDGFGPIQGGKGDDLILPWCIIRSLRSVDDLIVKDWQEQDAFTQSIINLQIYVISVKGSFDRQAFMRKQLAAGQLQASLVIGYDAKEVDFETFACWFPQSSLDKRSKRDLLGPSLLSLAMKYAAALWDMWQEGVELALILEDDAELSVTFNQDITEILLEAPSNWDMMMVGTCSDIHATEESRVSQHLFLPKFPDRPTRCAHSILWSYNGARKLLSSLPFRWELDWHINSAASEGNWTTFWLEPALSYQVKNFTSMLQPERDEISLND